MMMCVYYTQSIIYFIHLSFYHLNRFHLVRSPAEACKSLKEKVLIEVPFVDYRKILLEMISEHQSHQNKPKPEFSTLFAADFLRMR